MNGLDAKAMLRHLLRHPTHLRLLVAALWRLRATGWWRRAPFLPLPDRAYWRFRLSTATGSPSGSTSVREVVEFAKWSARQRVGR
ncbi:MAG: hypothetical protein WCA31_09195 [Acidimicrobiales bacterium]